jgi:phenylalanyl-tRNA synthetase beta chain
VYRPKAESAAMAMDEKSLAVRLTLNSDEATLNEAQIDGVVKAVLEQLATQLSARLRA